MDDSLIINGPIVIAEDDGDDRELFMEAVHACSPAVAIRFFENGMPALDYLRTTTEKPFIILCDVNMPVMDGLTFREEIQTDEFIRRKSIPFVFVSTDASALAVERAYDLTVQGFFKKPSSFDGLCEMIRLVLTYWDWCKHPNTVKR
jgi:CheY-like chemotaxis protein